MATIQGTLGGFTATGFNGKFVSWEADMSAEIFDTTGFGDGGFKTGEPIVAQITGVAVGILETTSGPFPDPSDPFAVASWKVATITLTVDGTRSISFPGNITSIAVGRAEEGPGSSSVRVSFASSGAVDITWA